MGILTIRSKPSGNPPPPNRTPTGDATELLLNLLARGAWGTTDPDPAAGGAVAVAAAMYAQAGAVGRVDAAPTYAAAVTARLPQLLAAHPRAGEWTGIAEIDGDTLTLTPVAVSGFRDGAWDATLYRRDTPYEVRVADVDLIRCVTHPDPADPNRGRPPWASHAAAAAAALEHSAAAEAGLAVGLSLSLHDPDDALDSGALTDLYARLQDRVGTAKGFLPLLTQGNAYSEPKAGTHSPLQRFGPEHPAAADRILDETSRAVLAACGVPTAVIAGESAPGALRDAQRAFLASAAQPVADRIAAALAAHLAANIAIDVAPPPTPADLVARARAVNSLASAGIEPERALTICGL
ncbi:MAG: hypothetical protein OXG44_20635 [Gammaproteobacteria bacterium]|nr:hypothetical protein [Gammaproteobacteria bacterium]